MHHILTSWLFKEIGFYQDVLFFLEFLVLKTFSGKYLIELLNILEGIHVVLFPFLIASGYIPDAPSSGKLPHTDGRE